MEVTPSSLDAIFRSFNLMYQSGYKQADPLYKNITMQISSVTRENNYAWMNKLPRMREWLGERVLQNASSQVYQVLNKDWELTLELDRNDIEDDQLGIYAPSAMMMGDSAAMHPDQIIWDLLKAGETSRIYDGQYFFDANHPVQNADGTGVTLQSNLVTGTPLTPAAYSAARAAMMSWIGEDGEPLGVMPDLLVVPPQLEGMALSILNADIVASAAGTAGISNVFKSSARVLVVPRLADRPLEWYLFCTTRPIKPMVFQVRKAVKFVQKTADTDENVFMRRRFIYGCDSRDNAGFGLWFLAYKGRG